MLVRPVRPIGAIFSRRFWVRLGFMSCGVWIGDGLRLVPETFSWRALSLIGEIHGRSGSESALRRRFAVSGQAEIFSVIRLDFADLTAAEFARVE